MSADECAHCGDAPHAGRCEEEEPRYAYAVVTEIPPNEKGGNMATALGAIYETLDSHMTYRSLGMDGINLAIPVFTLAEIMILDADTGREVAGRGRKPSKWDVSIEHFQVLEEAVLCATETIDNYATTTKET